METLTAPVDRNAFSAPPLQRRWVLGIQEAHGLFGLEVRRKDMPPRSKIVGGIEHAYPMAAKFAVDRNGLGRGVGRGPLMLVCPRSAVSSPSYLGPLGVLVSPVTGE